MPPGDKCSAHQPKGSFYQLQKLLTFIIPLILNFGKDGITKKGLSQDLSPYFRKMIHLDLFLDFL